MVQLWSSGAARLFGDAKGEALTKSHKDQNMNNQAIIGADPFGKIQLWNAGAEQLFGYTAAQVIGQMWTVPRRPRSPRGVDSHRSRGYRYEGSESSTNQASKFSLTTRWRTH